MSGRCQVEGHSGRKVRRKSVIRAAGALLVVGFSYCALAQQNEAAHFCETLQAVNNGAVDVRGLSEMQGHVKVLRQLLDASPAPIRADMQTLHDTIDGWAQALGGKNSMLKVFYRLSDPQLANVEGRISDYIASACGVRLDRGEYRADQNMTPTTYCPAWTSYGSPLTANRFPNYIDVSGANYFGQNFWLRSDVPAPKGMFKVEYGGWVEFHGQYPHARYFAYHPNDEDMNNLATLRDQDLDPDPGSVNPFREVAGPDAKRYYTARLMFTQRPLHPLPNTSYVGARKDGITPNGWVGHMIRLYASELGNGPNAGGVPLPAMTIYNAKGEVTYHADECEAYPQGGEPVRDHTLFAALPIADHRAVNPPRWGTSSNFNAPSDTWANADVQYLSTYYSHRFGDIFVVRAKAPTSPDTGRGESVSASAQKDSRLWTLCTYNFWAGIANDCKIDHDLERDKKGFYTLVISAPDSRPTNLKNQRATWMDWGAYLDGQLVYRTLYRENPLWRQVAFGVSGGAVSDAMRPFVPQAVPCSKKIFERDGWQGCFKSGGVDPAAYR